MKGLLSLCNVKVLKKLSLFISKLQNVLIDHLPVSIESLMLLHLSFVIMFLSCDNNFNKYFSKLNSFLAHLCELLPSFGVRRPSVNFFKNLKGNPLRIIQAKFGLNWPSGFRGEDF
jgi:hypothetical protein